MKGGNTSPGKGVVCTRARADDPLPADVWMTIVGTHAMLAYHARSFLFGSLALSLFCCLPDQTTRYVIRLV